MRMNKDDTNDDSLHNELFFKCIYEYFYSRWRAVFYTKELHFVTLFLIQSGEALLMQAN